MDVQPVNGGAPARMSRAALMGSCPRRNPACFWRISFSQWPHGRLELRGSTATRMTPFCRLHTFAANADA